MMDGTDQGRGCHSRTRNAELGSRSQKACQVVISAIWINLIKLRLALKIDPRRVGQFPHSSLKTPHQSAVWPTTSNPQRTTAFSSFGVARLRHEPLL